MGEEKRIRTNSFRIENNVIALGNNLLLQISNISYISVSVPPKKRFPYELLLIPIAGILLMLFNIYGIGFLLLLIGLICVILSQANNNKNDGKYLNVHMNCNDTYSIFCQNESFLLNVIGVIEYCINNHGVNNVSIDFDNCKIYNSPFTIGNKNEVHNENGNI